MKSFIYLNSNKSGIGDRLMDMILVYTFSKFLNCNDFILHWTEDSFDMVGNIDIYSNVRRQKTPFRQYDYLLENLKKYIELPKDIKFVDKNELDLLSQVKGNFVLKEYMGMKYNLYTFMKKYNIKEQTKFEELYFQNFKKIKFKNIPDNMINFFKHNKILTVHLRRGDKVVNDKGVSNNITQNQLQKLNEITSACTKQLMNKYNYEVYFVSDEEKTKKMFMGKFNVNINFKGDTVSQTYYDLYALSHSNCILLSQKFSVFSIFASMINKCCLFYMLKKSKMDEFKLYNNIKYINEKAYFISHQGFGDIFNTIGMVNYYNLYFDKIIILALDESRFKVLKGIYEKNKNITVCIPEFEKNVTSENTCFNCMMAPSLNKCRRNNSIKCKTLNYKNLENVILTGSFKNYNLWEKFKSNEFSFAHAFYTYNKISPEIRNIYFQIFNDKYEENKVYNEFVKKNGKDYILIHEDSKRNYKIDKSKINHNYVIINLNNISNNFVNFTKVIKNSKEIHLIDSSWSVFIYFLSIKELNIPVYMNETLFKRMGRDTNIYKNPTPENWTFY